MYAPTVLDLGGDLAELMQEPPDTLAGIPIGVGDWRLVVEILVPSVVASLLLEDEDGEPITDEDGEPIEVDGYGSAGALAVWDIAIWDESAWSALGWLDVTGDVRGLEWTRGADEPWGRPRVGTGTITLDTNDDDRWSPWNPTPQVISPAYLQPGTVCRVGVRSATDDRCGGWLPQFCAVVGAWNPSYAGRGGERWVDIDLVETVTQLAQIDDNALESPVGPGDSFLERIVRLLEQAVWRFGLIVRDRFHYIGDGTAGTVLSTDMASNRIAECYIVADSVDGEFLTDKTGAAVIATRFDMDDTATDIALQRLAEFSIDTDDIPRLQLHPLDTDPVAAGDPGYLRVVYDPDDLVTTNDDVSILNDFRWANVGGSQQVAEHVVSIGQHGRKSSPRTDLVNTSDAALLAVAVRRATRHGSVARRLDSATIDVHRQPDDAALAVLALELGDRLDFVAPPLAGSDEVGDVGLRGFTRSTVHRVTPLNGSEVLWTVAVALDADECYGLLGGQLEYLEL